MTPASNGRGRSDEDLLLCAARGDADAFGVFYDRHVATVVSWFVRRTACPTTARDLAAETFAEALRSVHQFRSDRGEPRAWLFGIARNQWRRYARTGDISDRALRRLGMAPDQRDHADTVAAQVDLQALALTVEGILDRLSTSVAHAVRLRVLEELPYAEVAQRLGCTEGAARVRVARGLAALHGDSDLRERFVTGILTPGWRT